MSKSLVGFCHFVNVFAFLHCLTFVFRSGYNFVRKFYMHRFSLFRSRGTQNPTVCQRHSSLSPDLAGNLIGCASDPARTNLKLRTMNEGIEVEGIDGDIEATSLNDEVTLINVAGSVVADSRNDDVKVTMSRLSPDKPMAFSSVNGDVDVTLPANVKASVRMSTVNGDIYTDVDMQVSGGTNAALSRPGRNRVMAGTINGGGPNFQLSSVNGNIYIRKGR